MTAPKGVMSPNLKSALRKLEHNDGRVWCAYLTPSEILALMADGARTSDAFAATRAAQRSKIGDGTPEWFYCTPGTNKPLAQGQHHTGLRQRGG